MTLSEALDQAQRDYEASPQWVKDIHERNERLTERLEDLATIRKTLTDRKEQIS